MLFWTLIGALMIVAVSSVVGVRLGRSRRWLLGNALLIIGVVLLVYYVREGR